MGLFEPQHLIIILVIALVIFGPGKIADLGGTLGRGIRDFKKAMNEDHPAAAPTEPVTPSRERESLDPAASASLHATAAEVKEASQAR